MSFPRHREIYPSDGGAVTVDHAPAHRLDEFPVSYSLTGCAPALPVYASPTAFEYAVGSSCPSIVFQPTANSVLTICVSRGGKLKASARLHATLRPRLDFALVSWRYGSSQRGSAM